jgi:hypothetical protein
MRNKLPIMEQRPLLRMRQLRIQSRSKRRPLRLPQKKSQRNRRVGTKQPLPQLRIHQPLQARRTTKQKQNMAKKKTAVLHAKNHRVAPKQNGQPFSLLRANHSILLNIFLDSNDTRGPVVQSGMNAAFACPVQKKAEAAGSNPARSTRI